MQLKRIAGTALVLLAAACSDTGSGPGGKSQILLTDSPFPYDRISRVDMHIVRIQVSAIADTMIGSTWITVAEPNRTINLLELQSGQTTLLGETDVNVTSVSAVRVVINTSLSSLTRSDGSAQPVRWPVAGELTLNAYVQASLALFTEDTPHNLVIDFDVGRSFEDLGDGQLTFIPWIRALDDAGAGTVAGTIRADADSNGTFTPLPFAAVTVLQGEAGTNPNTWWKVATGRTDASGNYRVAFILMGNYVVRVEPLGAPTVGCKDVTGVIVSNGTVTDVDVDLPGAPGTCARQTGGGGGPDTVGTNPDTTGTPTGGPVAGVVVTPGTQTVNPNDSLGVYANLRNAAGASLYGRPVTFTISDTTVVRFQGIYGQSALLRAKKTGSVTVTATSEGVSGTATVQVR